MSKQIEINERILGEFARKQDAQAVVLALLERDWPAVYVEEGAPQWRFETLAEYRRFMGDFEAVRDERARAGSLRISWGCDCEEVGLEGCPHGDDPQSQAEPETYEEMTPWRIRRQVEERYPDFADRLQAIEQSLYNAVWFAGIFEKLTGDRSATGLFLHSEEWRAGPETDVGRLDVAAGLLHFAEHDAAFEALWSGAGHELEDLKRIPRCETCGDWVDFGCRCEESVEA